MKLHTPLFILGLLTFVTPFSGLPLLAESIIISAYGLAIMILVSTIKKDSKFSEEIGMNDESEDYLEDATSEEVEVEEVLEDESEPVDEIEEEIEEEVEIMPEEESDDSAEENELTQEADEEKAE
jgi:hypothetical protein